MISPAIGSSLVRQYSAEEYKSQSMLTAILLRPELRNEFRKRVLKRTDDELDARVGRLRYAAAGIKMSAPMSKDATCARCRATRVFRGVFIIRGLLREPQRIAY